MHENENEEWHDSVAGEDPNMTDVYETSTNPTTQQVLIHTTPGAPPMSRVSTRYDPRLNPRNGALLSDIDQFYDEKLHRVPITMDKVFQSDYDPNDTDRSNENQRRRTREYHGNYDQYNIDNFDRSTRQYPAGKDEHINHEPFSHKQTSSDAITQLSPWEISRSNPKNQAKPVRVAITPSKYSSTGDLDADDFILHFDRASASNVWTAELKQLQFPSYLVGPALTWYNCYIAEKTRLNQTNFDWETLKKDFLQQFSDTKNSFHLIERKLQELKQAPNEPCLSYATKVERYINKLDPYTTDTMRLMHVARGLTRENLFTVKMQNPKTMEALRTIFKNIDEVNNIYMTNNPIEAISYFMPPIRNTAQSSVLNTVTQPDMEYLAKRLEVLENHNKAHKRRSHDNRQIKDQRAIVNRNLMPIQEEVIPPYQLNTQQMPVAQGSHYQPPPLVENANHAAIRMDNINNNINPFVPNTNFSRPRPTKISFADRLAHDPRLQWLYNTDRCFFCTQEGHRSKVCPIRQQQQTLNSNPPAQQSNTGTNLLEQPSVPSNNPQ